MASQPIHIIGAGIAGLTLGRQLKSKGIPAILFEKGDSPARHNYGISLYCWPPFLKLLNMDEATFRSRLAVDAGNGGNGRIYPESVSKSFGPKGEPCFRAHCGRLESLLREGLNIRWKHTFEEISYQDGENVIIFTEGEKVTSNFTIDTSGVHTPLRKYLSAESQLNVLPYVVFRGTRKLKAEIFKALYAPVFNSANVLETKRDDVTLQISINTYEAHSVDISYVYSRPARTKDPLDRPGRGKEEAGHITNDFYAEVSRFSEQYAELESPFKDAFDVDLMKKDRILHWLMRTSMVTMTELNDLAGRGVAMIGDALHSMPILGGDGCNLAVLDGIELGQYLAAHGNSAINGYYEKRYKNWQNRVKDARRRLAEIHYKKMVIC